MRIRDIAGIFVLLSMIFCVIWWISSTTTEHFFMFGLPAISSVVIFQILYSFDEPSGVPRFLRLSLAFGAFLNLLVLTFNKGFMPVYGVSLDKIYGSHCLMTASSKLPILCDIIPSPLGIFSIGDLFIIVPTLAFFGWRFLSK